MKEGEKGKGGRLVYGVNKVRRRGIVEDPHGAMFHVEHPHGSSSHVKENASRCTPG